MRFCFEDPAGRRRGAILVVKAPYRQQQTRPLRVFAPFALLSRAIAGAASAANREEDGSHASKKRRALQQPAPPQSLAPWHTLPYMGREVHHLAAVLRYKVGSSVARARHSWHEHRRTAKARRAHGKHGSHLHLRLPWRRRHEDEAANQQRREQRGPQHAARAAAERGFQRQKALDIDGAIEAFEEATKLVPGHAEYLACLSKQWSDITFIPGTPDAEAKSCAEKGIAFAEQALEADPACATAHVASCVAKGRLTFFVDNRRKVELAASARKDTEAALAADPENDLAHHLMGRWHTEMAQLNFMVRALIKVVFGATLAPGSHAEALAAYERAVDLAPQRLIHRVELARAALRLGQTMRAARELQVAVDMEVEDINAHLTRLDGVEMLEKLRRQGRLAELQPALPLSDAIAADGSDSTQAAGGGGSQPAGGSLA